LETKQPYINQSAVPVVRRKRDVGDVAKYRARRSFQVASRLQVAAVAAGNLAALGCADRLRVCGSPSNLWLGEDLHNEDGECFEGVGTLWHCGQVICPSCLSERRRRMRRRVREGLSRAAASGDSRWRFITLTAPNLPGVNLDKACGIFNRAWSLFRKRGWWVGKIRAAIKGMEFTLGDEKRLAAQGREWDFETDGYNVHLHVMVLSGWIAWKELGEEWTACLKKALSEAGCSDEIKTSHGRAVVDVRLVVDKKRNKSGNTITEAGAVEEVCKYLTKAESWLEVPDEQLLEIAGVGRWGRMVELLGECRAPRAHRSIEVSPREDSEDLPAILNTLRAARGDFDEVVNKVYQESLSELNAARGTLYESQVRVEVAKRLRREAAAYLDTQCLSDGGSSSAFSNKALNRSRGAPLERGPTLRKLCLEVPRDEWLKILYLRVNAVQTFRRRSLIGRYPCARFESLSGERFGGGWDEIENY
jgi:hypothetical protein